MSGLVSLSLASVLAFHPYSAPSAAPTGTQPGWDEVEAETAADAATDAATAGEVPPPTVDPANVAPAPAAAAPAPAVAKPEYKKGTGLIIGASITGGLAWIVGLTRMGFVKQCQDKLEESEDIPTGTEAAKTCFLRAGAGNVALAFLQVPLNWATWGLAPAAGVVRGRYDGVDAAWEKKQARKTAAFIGAGAAVLAVGIIGRITAAALVLRPYQKLADGDVDGFFGGIRGRLFGVQLSSAAIGLGAGLLAYGVAYRKNFDSENRRLQQVRLTPQLNFDPTRGTSYTGLAMTGRF
jgi:hypothetical protein